MVSWIVHLLCLKNHPNEHSVRSQWNAVHSKFIKLTTSGKKELLSSFLARVYEAPGLHQSTDNANSTPKSKAGMREEQSRTVHLLRLNLAKAYDELSQYSRMMEDIAAENAILTEQVAEFQAVKQKFSQKGQEIAMLKIKIASMSTKNVNRRMKRKDEKIKNLSMDIEARDNKVKDAEIEIEQYKTELKELIQELGKIKSKKVTEQKAKHYWKQKANSLTAKSNVGGQTRQ